MFDYAFSLGRYSDLQKRYEGKELSEQIDDTLQYNDDDEDYISKMGYWIEDDLDTKKVTAITVYVREAEDSESFFKYEWVDTYTK